MTFPVSTRDRRMVGAITASLVLFFAMLVISDYAHQSAGEVPVDLLFWLVGAAIATGVGGALFVPDSRIWRTGFVTALVGSCVFMLAAYSYGLFRLPRYKSEKVLLFAVCAAPTWAIYWHWCTRKARDLGIHLTWRIGASRTP